MAFDPDKYLASKQAPAAFDPDAYLESKNRGVASEGGGLVETLNEVSKKIDSYTGAPTRAAIGAAQDGRNPLPAFANQFGEDPERAPTGKQLVTRAGVSDTKRLSPTSQEKSKMGVGEMVLSQAADPLNFIPGLNLLPESVKDSIRNETPVGNITRADAAGLGMDVAADYTNFIPVGLVARGGQKVAQAAGVTNAAERIAEAGKAAKLATGEKLKDLAETASFKSSGAMLKDFQVAHGKGKVNELGRYMLDNGLKAGDSVDDIAAKFSGKLTEAGQRLDRVYQKAEDAFGEAITKIGFDPKRDRGRVLAAARKELGNAEGADAAVEKLSNYLDEIAARHGDKPMEMATAKYLEDVQKFRKDFANFRALQADRIESLGEAARDANQGVLFKVDDGQRTVKGKEAVEVRGSPRAEMRAAPAPELTEQMYLPDLPTARSEAERVFGSVDNPFGQNMGSRVEQSLVPSAQQGFLDQNTAEQISLFGRQGQIEGADLVPRRFAEAEVPRVAQVSQPRFIDEAPVMPTRPKRPQDIRNPMSPRGSQDIKTEMDQVINYGRNPLKSDPVKERAFHAGRRELSKVIDESFDSLGGGTLVEELKRANKEYGNAATISALAKDRVARDSANQMFSLTDKIVGTGAGSGVLADAERTVSGGLAAAITGTAAATASKLVRKYGTTTIAVAADRVSKNLLRVPQMRVIAETKPQVYQAIVINMTRRVLEKGETLKAVAGPDGAPSELDNDSGVPANYREYPDGARVEPPKKGPEKWAADGFRKLLSSADAGMKGDLEGAQERLMKSAKGRSLLIAASDLKPGTKAMKGVLSQIKSELAKGKS